MKHRRQAVAEMLLDQGSDSNLGNYNGLSPLHTSGLVVRRSVQKLADGSTDRTCGVKTDGSAECWGSVWHLAKPLRPSGEFASVSAAEQFTPAG